VLRAPVFGLLYVGALGKVVEGKLTLTDPVMTTAFSALHGRMQESGG
jgi:hypothetical protein